MDLPAGELSCGRLVDVAELLAPHRIPSLDLSPLLVCRTELAAEDNQELLTIANPRVVLLWMANPVLLHEMGPRLKVDARS